MSYLNSSAYEKLDKLGRISILLWTLYFAFPQFITLIIFQSLGILLSYTAYHWILHIGLVIIGLISYWQYDKVIVKLGLLPTFLFMGYIYFRYLQPAQLILNPIMFVLNIIVLTLAAFNIIFILIDLIGRLFLVSFGKIKIFNRRDYTSKEGKSFLISLLLLFGVWLPLLLNANSGFGQKITIKDNGNTIERVGFWNFPIWGNNYESYLNSNASEELQLYGEINGFFFIPFSRGVLENDQVRSNYTAIFNLWKSFGIEVIFDASAIIDWLNVSSGTTIKRGDFVTYHYIKEVNESIDAIVQYVQEDNITNFRGISLDIEPPQYRNASSYISPQLYHQAVDFINQKFNYVNSIFPDVVFNMISMESIMWDVIDSDFDLSIQSLTMDIEINWDYYGYMTYHAGDTPGYTSYEYLIQMQQGYRAHKNQFQPWLGWWSNNPESKYPLLKENSIIYNRTFEQIKMAKNSGADEIVLAPIRAFKGLNHTEGMDRLNKLKDILINGFDDFEIGIGRKNWLENIFPTYWIAQRQIFHDIIDGTDYYWYTISHLLLFVSIIIFGITKFKKHEKNDREER